MQISDKRPTIPHCPPWCTTDRATHEREWKGGSTFHSSEPHDGWTLDYRSNPVEVTAEVYSTPGHADELLIVVKGDLGRGSQDLAELTAADAERLGRALLAAVEVTRA